MRKNHGLRADTLFQSISVAIALAIVCRVVTFGRGIFLARTLAPEELGMWALMVNAIGVLAFVCTLGVPNGLARYTDRYRREGILGRFFASTLSRVLAITAAVCLIGFLCWQPVGQLLFSSSASCATVSLTLGAVLVTALFTLAQAMLHGLGLFRTSSLFELAQNVLFLALAVLLLSTWSGDAYAATWAHLLTTLLAAMGIGWWLCRSMNRADRSDLPRKPDVNIVWWPMLAYSLGAWCAGSLQSLWRVIDRYMLLHLSTAGTPETLDHIGQYFVASKVCQPLSALAGVLSVALLPHAAKLWESNRRAEVADIVRLITKLLALIMTFGGAVLVACKPYVIEFVTGRSDTMAVAVLAPVLVTVTAVSLHCVLRTHLLCCERTWSVGGVWLATFLANAVLNALLIPRFELMGAAWATLVSAGLAVLLTAWLSARNGMHVDKGLGCCLLVPAVLLLPAAALPLSLALVAAVVWFTELLFTEPEKKRINQWCAERFASGGGRVARMLALSAR